MTSSSGLKKRFEAETLPLFPVRVRRLVSDHRVGVCRSSAGGEGGGSQDRTVPRLLLPRPFTLQLCGGQKRSLPPPPPPRATSPQPRFKETQLRRSGPNNGGTPSSSRDHRFDPPNLAFSASSERDVIDRKPRPLARPLLADCSINLPYLSMNLS